jgi:hypothetical protein
MHSVTPTDASVVMVDYPRSRSWVGLQCGVPDCEYSVLSPDTTEGVEELMMLHIMTKHPGQRWQDSRGRVHQQ